jgi:hypothetical protein
MRSRLATLSLTCITLACGDSSGDGDGSSDPTEDTSVSASASATNGDDASGDDGPTSAGSLDDASSEPTSADDDDGVDTSAGSTADSDTTGDPGELELPPPDGGLDYQLGGAYPPPDGVTIVSRDRNEAPVGEGVYDICYVNGYQIQPDEEAFWLDEHPDLILRDDGGNPVIDPDWDEMLLDISTPEKREAIAAIVGEWIVGCGAAGYEAVEIDNLDTYSRSMGLLTQDHAVAFMVLLSEAAHGAGLAIAQKNSTELVPRKDEMGTDFVVAEECNRYEECGDYIDAYGDAVLMIEYRVNDFEAGCAAYGTMSIVLRDLNLVMPGDAAYVYDAC